jgi:hypothetical protein
LCLFNKVTHRAQAEVFRRISLLASSVKLSRDHDPIITGSGAALCLFNKVTHRAQAEVLRRISLLASSVRLSLAKATHQVQAIQPVVSSPLR